MAKYAPTGWPVVIPRIVADDPMAVVEFIREIFGAASWVSSTAEREAMPLSLYVYVEDADAVYRRAVGRGAESIEDLGTCRMRIGAP